ncbi:MAG: DNA alkylation repair protein [Ruminococcus sp.]|nr:DNA alkylation repair protein [Ruminococcus sp.]
MTEIQNRLFELQDQKYRDLTVKLNPSIAPDTIIGVRLPQLRAYAKELIKGGLSEDFLSSLPHKYFDENMLHALILCEEKDFEKAVQEIERFLPYADSWAITDTLSPKAFAKHPDRLPPYIEKWLDSDLPYTVRFGILCLMKYFLGGLFEERHLDMVCDIQSEEYYVNMMRAWYLATALAKQYPPTVKLLEENRLDRWTHNKTIQKAVESYRVTDEHKTYLKTLKRK